MVFLQSLSESEKLVTIIANISYEEKTSHSHMSLYGTSCV